MDYNTSTHDDALFITVEINDFDMKISFVDFGSSTDVLFLDALLTMGKTKKGHKKVVFP